MSSEQIGEYIKKNRKRKKITAKELEKLSTVSQSHISLIELGKRFPSPDVLKKIAPFIGVTYEELMRIAGYLQNEDTSLAELAHQLKESLKENKVIDIEKLSEYSVNLNGRKIDSELLKRAIEYVQFLAHQNEK